MACTHSHTLRSQVSIRGEISRDVHWSHCRSSTALLQRNIHAIFCYVTSLQWTKNHNKKQQQKREQLIGIVCTKNTMFSRRVSAYSARLFPSRRSITVCIYKWVHTWCTIVVVVVVADTVSEWKRKMQVGRRLKLEATKFWNAQELKRLMHGRRRPRKLNTETLCVCLCVHTKKTQP